MLRVGSWGVPKRVGGQNRGINSLGLKELSHEIEMGCLWYGWKEP